MDNYWNPVVVKTTEMHTAGETFRIVESGYPEIHGATILDKIRYLKQKMDEIRKMLKGEPRGFADMFGCILVPADIKEADVGVIFTHNEGYSSMCGHGVISLGRFLVDKGFVKNPVSPETKVAVQCPCGLVEAFVEFDDTNQRSGRVRYKSVPSFLFAKDVEVHVPHYGQITVDISFGGAFFAIVPASAFGLDVAKDSVEALRKAGGDTVDAMRKQVKVTHPESEDLAYIYGIIITDEYQETQETLRHLSVFADRQVDRSPCGSGTTARVAQMFFRNQLTLGQSQSFRGPTKGTFIAKVVEKVNFGPHPAAVIEVSGHGYYCGTATYTLEDGDDIGSGFLLK